MKNAAMNFRSMPSSIRRILTLLVVFAVVLVTLPLQANAQEWSTTSTTAYDTADDNDWTTESTSEPVEQPSATSKVSKTSAARPGDYTEDPALSDVAEPAEESTELIAPSEAVEPGLLGEIAGETLPPEVELESEFTSVHSPVRSAFRMFAPSIDTYTGTSDYSGFWANKYRADNNEITPRCGLKVGLVFDLSGSIGVDGLKNSKLAGNKVIDTLSGSAGTQVGIFSFNTGSETLHAGYDMATETTQARNAINRLRIDSADNTGGTNWEGGLKQVNRAAELYGEYNIVYFITDGVPTTNNTANFWGSPRQDYGSITHNDDIVRAIGEANILKGNGTRLEVLAVNMNQLEVPVLRDEVTLRSGANYVQNLGSFNSSRELITHDPKFRWGAGNYRTIRQRDNAVVNGALIYAPTASVSVLAGADVTAKEIRGTVIVEGREWWSWDEYKLPRYSLNQPSARQIAISLAKEPSAITEVNYDQLAETLEAMLPRPCIADLTIEKEVVDQVGEADKNTGVSGWEFKMDSLPPKFSFQSGSKASVTTDNKGVAQWNFKTESPNANGIVDITEIVRSGTDAKLQNVVCRDSDSKEIQVNHDGQKFTIKLEAGGRYSCKVMNQIPGFEVSKRAAADQNLDIEGDQPVADVKADGSFTAFYHIDVQNLSKSQNTVTKRVVDTLVYPEGFTADEVIFTMNGNRVNATYRNGSYEIPATSFTRFNANETKTINVEVRGKASPAAQQSINNGTYKNCEAGGGLKNQVSMDGDLDKTNNEACVDVTIEDILLKLLKVDHNDVRQALGGAQFTLFRANGDQIGEQVAVFDSGSQDDGSHSTRVELGAEYFIVETRAPSTYSLLPAPIRISVNAGQNGIEVQVLNPKEAFSATPKVSEEPGVAILQVADLQSGALPKSGGMGVVPFAIVALLILGLGAFMLRRRM